MAEMLADRYILSVKAHPSAVAGSALDAAAVRADIRRILETTDGCVVEIIMKDNHTIGGRPENVIEWCAIARQEAERLGPG
jgi:hypothetical protein